MNGKAEATIILRFSFGGLSSSPKIEFYACGKKIYLCDMFWFAPYGLSMCCYEYRARVHISTGQ